MTNYFIIPGYQGSGADHWQTWIETTQPNFHRIQQRDWEHPDISEWADNIDKFHCRIRPRIGGISRA